MPGYTIGANDDAIFIANQRLGNLQFLHRGIAFRTWICNFLILPKGKTNARPP
jgi:hypothetical protein